MQGIAIFPFFVVAVALSSVGGVWPEPPSLWHLPQRMRHQSVEAGAAPSTEVSVCACYIFRTEQADGITSRLQVWPQMAPSFYLATQRRRTEAPSTFSSLSSTRTATSFGGGRCFKCTAAVCLSEMEPALLDKTNPPVALEGVAEITATVVVEEAQRINQSILTRYHFLSLR